MWRRAIRRFRGTRASAMLEFALVMPLIAMIVSAMIEFTALWDAKIMANHTAWTVGRIMTVRAGQRPQGKETSLLGKKPKNIVDAFNPKGTGIDGAYTATALLMSTCSMGSMHGSAADFSKDYITGWIKEGMDALKNYIKDKIAAGIKDAVKKVISSIAGQAAGDSAIARRIGEAIANIAGGVAEAIADVITSAMTSLIPQSFYDKIGEFLNGNRQIRQVVYAADRVAKYNVVQVNERDDGKIPAFGKGSITSYGQLEFPESFDKAAKNDGWMVTQASGWPPNKQRQRMIDVKIAWPFERAWMFPVLSSDGTTDMDKVPTAVGRALFYPQPAIFNENLSSSSPKAFDPGNTNSVLDVAKELQAQYANYLKMAKFAYDYRLCEEVIGPYDSCSRTIGISYKGIGYPIEGEANEDLIYKLDGLVVWMERAPAKPGDHDSWKKKKAPADYKKCFKEISGKGDEVCKFWHGFAFAAKKTAALENFENRKYKDKEWFFWGDDRNRHSRYWHRTPVSMFNAFARPWSFVSQPQPRYRWYSFLLNEGIGARWKKETVIDKAAMVPDDNLYLQCCNGFKECASHPQWSSFVAANRDFAATWEAIVKFYAGEQLLASLTARENTAMQRALVLMDKQNSELLSFVRQSRDELGKMIGGDGEVDVSETGFFDFGGDDEEIMKDPSKAVEKMKEKLANLKTTLNKLLLEIDGAERNLRTKGNVMYNALEDVGVVREKSVMKWIGTVACGIRIAQSLKPADIEAAIKANLPAVATDFELSTKKLETASEEYRKAYVRLYNAELAYAKAIGLKTSGKTPLDPSTDPKFNPDEPPDPLKPEESSSESGSDKDGLGDFWKHEEDEWKTYNDKEDR